eukprot:14281150-Alexandrium_andersonii.AAC.1
MDLRRMVDADLAVEAAAAGRQMAVLMRRLRRGGVQWTQRRGTHVAAVRAAMKRAGWAEVAERPFA